MILFKMLIDWQGCDMRNVIRIILWELPTSFCALVQRAGRAARDFSTLGEAILIVPGSLIAKGTTEREVEAAIEEVRAEVGTEAENRGEDEMAVLEGSGIELLDEGGVRIAHGQSEDEDTVPTAGRNGRAGQSKTDFNSREVKYLNHFVRTKTCRRTIWNDFFGNSQKGKKFEHLLTR